jgi:hypothetical protein
MITDPAVGVACAYLRINGYFTLTEFDVHERTADGYRAVTDIDIIAVRLPSGPGTSRYAGRRPKVEAGIITSLDPAFDVAERLADIVFAEVKQGEARFNPGLHTPAALHAGLRRVGGDLGAPIDEVVDALLDHARGLLPDVVALRRRIHRHPELGLDLPETQRAVLDALDGLGR